METDLIIRQNKGFALLLTLVVVSVILTIGLSLIDSTIKQLSLSSSSRDSEIAFQTAYAGIECGEYWGRLRRDEFINAGVGGQSPILTDCLKSTPVTGTQKNTFVPNVYLSQYQISWGNNPIPDKCTEFDLYFLDAMTANSDVSYSFPYYGNGAPKICNSGSICTYVFSRGYNRACNDLNNIQSVERELVSHF